MSTRSIIAKENQDGSITAVYCHWDGCPSNNGKILLENYKTEKQVDKLLSKGSMSSLGEKCTKPKGHSFDSIGDKYFIISDFQILLKSGKTIKNSKSIEKDRFSMK